jgi:hypothetical protein
VILHALSFGISAQRSTRISDERSAVAGAGEHQRMMKNVCQGFQNFRVLWQSLQSCKLL